MLSQPPSPPSLPIRDWRSAENFAAWHLVHSLGYLDAVVTGGGADGGLDVVANNAVGQVKHHSKPVGRPDLQRLRGASFPSRVPYFFALSGFTVGALSYARVSNMPLFTYSVQGDLQPVNDAARDALAAAGERSIAIAQTDRKSVV